MGNGQERGGACTQDGAQVVEGLAQVVARLPLGVLGPEEAGQGLAAVGEPCLDGQVGQQSAHAVGSKGRDWLPVEMHLERPK